MQMHSAKIETALMPRVTQIAMMVLAPSINDITKGPASLQNRSIRRILAFIFLTISTVDPGDDDDLQV